MNTVENLDTSLDNFKESGVQGIVLDQEQSGGYIDQAIEVAKRFVPRGL